MNEDIIGSMEFACKIAGSKIIVVLGHTRCEVVRGARDDVKLGNLTALLKKIKPAIEAETETFYERSSANANFVENFAHLNVIHTLNEIQRRSQVLSELIDQGTIIVVGAMYNVETGVVEFYEDRLVHKVRYTKRTKRPFRGGGILD